MTWHQTEFVEPTQNSQCHLHLEICRVLPKAYPWPSLKDTENKNHETPQCPANSQTQNLGKQSFKYLPEMQWTWMEMHFGRIHLWATSQVWMKLHLGPSCIPFYPLSRERKLPCLLLLLWFHPARHHLSKCPWGPINRKFSFIEYALERSLEKYNLSEKQVNLLHSWKKVVVQYRTWTSKYSILHSLHALVP